LSFLNELDSLAFPWRLRELCATGILKMETEKKMCGENISILLDFRHRK